MSTYANFTHRSITTSQGNIALWDSYEGSPAEAPTLLFIHGHLANKDFFDRQLKSPLFSSYRVIALDLPGYGRSDPPKDAQKVYSFPGFADVVAEVVTAMQLSNILVVGWSLGGHIALELIERLPQLKGLLITGTAPIEVSELGLSQGFQLLDERILECFGKGNLSYEEAQLLATISGYDFTNDKEFLVDAVIETDEGAKTIYPRSIIEGIGKNGRDIVSTWPRPIAVIAGEHDIAINNNYIANDVPFKNLWNSKIHVIPNSGHACFMERPDAFNDILHRFCQDVFRKQI